MCRRRGSRRLAVGQQADPIEAGARACVRPLIGRAGDHATPVAGELDGRGEERRSGLDGGESIIGSLDFEGGCGKAVGIA